ncbi:MAG TPA: quinoprotein dehydrogenase-associated putative ABC transporter substrate-binding protein [Gemmatimonadales bacterium]|nr:quinoprotein dehydrogenase-associated putative ABC transporter substrate-binding protein [Gemmatimonadales bacterium]
MATARRLARALPLLAGLAAATPLAAQRPNLPTPGVLRVCADPDNLPLSNTKGEGYENKIAELIAAEWKSRLEYAWWPVRRGFFSRALNGRYCDVAITAPEGMDMAAVTRPYYRSAYVIVTRKDSGLDIKSLDDPALKKLKIGVNLLNSDGENPPPVMALSAHGVVGNLTGFSTFYSDVVRPEDIINAVIGKQVDVAIVWGPLAGYFGKRSPVPLTMNVLEYDSLTGMPFAFNLGLATRRRDAWLRDSLQAFLDRRRPQIEAILRDYGVPLLPIREGPKLGDEDDDERPAGTASPAGDAPRPPSGPAPAAAGLEPARSPRVRGG